MLLKINNLKIYYRINEGVVKAVDNVSFQLGVGEVLGLVGESGCGKTTLAKSILRLLPRNSDIKGGEILFNDKNLLKLKETEIRKIRWKEISMISQSAMNALDPVYRVGDQLVEAIITHERLSKKEAWSRAIEAFNMVEIDPVRMKDYPHQFSGGMRQRAIIAMSLILNPSLIIADEPTTALDVIVQAQILDKMIKLEKKFNSSMIIITHDISVVAGTCNKIAVMYAGKLMEFGSIKNVFKKPLHPYMLGLKNAFPSIKGKKQELISIQGTPPDLLNPPSGCCFYSRCPFTREICREKEPEMIEFESGHFAACNNLEAIEEMRYLASQKETWENIMVNGGGTYKKV